MNWNQRLTQARLAKNIRKSALAKMIGVSAPTVTLWENGETKKIEGTNLINVCAALGITPEWLLDGQEATTHSANQTKEEYKTPHRRIADFELLSADMTDAEVGHIEYWDAKGSCGGGFLNYDQLPAGHLVKEITFFTKYGIRPENAFAIYADGDSMADFIVDGDIVIFDKTKTEPRNGKIFVIEHPEGLRIKQLRRDIDGSWVLESKNPDKRAFPDERITPDQIELLKLHGQFVYRQGG